MQFLTAESVNSDSAGTKRGQACPICKQPIGATYYALGDTMICPVCSAKARAGVTGSRWGRLAKASLFGLGAGIVGALIWFVIRRVTNYEIGLVAILVGVMVGTAVRKGSAGVGGRGYQILAVAITYCCIAANYMPDILESVIKSAREPRAVAAQPAGDAASRENVVDPGAVAPTANADQDPREKMGVGKAILAVILLIVIVFAISLAAPFLAGAENLIGLLIIGFALWEAWKLNAHHPLPISGPYQIGPEPEPGSVA